MSLMDDINRVKRLNKLIKQTQYKMSVPRIYVSRGKFVIDDSACPDCNRARREILLLTSKVWHCDHCEEKKKAQEAIPEPVDRDSEITKPLVYPDDWDIVTLGPRLRRWYTETTGQRCKVVLECDCGSSACIDVKFYATSGQLLGVLNEVYLIDALNSWEGSREGS